jgi:zinc/manganese transport system substrate-binding protein
MKRLIPIASTVLLALGMQTARADIKVLACEPEWGALVKELAGDKASVYVATTGLQDPHRIEARPSLVAAARNTQLVVCTGAELEVGWLPLLIRQSGNSAIQPGKPGNFEAAAYVRKLEIPDRLDRADGDVHAAGNPHIQTDPRNIALVAEPLARRLAELDPANASVTRPAAPTSWRAGRRPSSAGTRKPHRCAACRSWCSTRRFRTCSNGWGWWRWPCWSPSPAWSPPART